MTEWKCSCGTWNPLRHAFCTCGSFWLKAERVLGKKLVTR